MQLSLIPNFVVYFFSKRSKPPKLQGLTDYKDRHTLGDILRGRETGTSVFVCIALDTCCRDRTQARAHETYKNRRNHRARQATIASMMRFLLVLVYFAAGTVCMCSPHDLTLKLGSFCTRFTTSGTKLCPATFFFLRKRGCHTN